jgi:hypothetical protein
MPILRASPRVRDVMADAPPPDDGPPAPARPGHRWRTPPAEPSDDALRARFDDAAAGSPRDEVDWYVGGCRAARVASTRSRLGPTARCPSGTRHHRSGADGSGAALTRRARLASEDSRRRSTPVPPPQPADTLRAAILDGSAFTRIADPVAARLALERLHVCTSSVRASDHRRACCVRGIALRRAAGRNEKRSAG